MGNRGFFIAVEGGDGAGKGGVAAALAAHLEERGLPVVTTREPGGTPEGDALRALLLAEAGTVWDPQAELLLMTAARVQHVRRVILPAVEEGRVVVSDRFVGSTIAYQGAGRSLSQAFIHDLHREAVGDLRPDLTLVLDLNPLIGLGRSRRRLRDQAVDEGRFEGLDLGFHQRVRQSFLDQAAADPARFAVIDAGRAIADVQAEAVARVAALLEAPAA